MPYIVPNCIERRQTNSIYWNSSDYTATAILYDCWKITCYNEVSAIGSGTASIDSPTAFLELRDQSIVLYAFRLLESCIAACFRLYYKKTLSR